MDGWKREGRVFLDLGFKKTQGLKAGGLGVGAIQYSDSVTAGEMQDVT
jgi:hypothetical protein